jgi:hypothetical protein
MFAMMKKNISENTGSFWQEMYDSYKRNQPQFKLLKSTLHFSGDKTLFTPVADSESGSRNYFSNDPIVNQNNVIYSDWHPGCLPHKRKSMKKLSCRRTASAGSTGNSPLKCVP